MRPSLADQFPECLGSHLGYKILKARIVPRVDSSGHKVLLELGIKGYRHQLLKIQNLAKIRRDIARMSWFGPRGSIIGWGELG